MVAGATLAVAALAGCSAGQAPGVAAEVNGSRITSDYLSDAAGLNDYLQTPMTNSQLLAVLIQARAALPAAERAGVGVSAEQASALLAEIDEDVKRPAIKNNPATVELARLMLLQQNASGDSKAQGVVMDTLASLTSENVEVNPRFGSWDGTRGSLTPTVPAWVEQTESATQGQ